MMQPELDDPSLEPHQSPSRVNLFKLPNQAAILLTLLVCVLYTTWITSTLTASNALLTPLFALSILISLRAMVSWPERVCRQYHLIPAPPNFTPLQEQIAQLANQLQLKQVPQLMIGPGDDGPAIFGSWRRWYLRMGYHQATIMCAQILEHRGTASINATLLHELSHFKYGSLIFVEYSRALLRTGVWFTGWIALTMLASLTLSAAVFPVVFRHSPADFARAFEAGLPGTGSLILSLFPSDEQWRAWQERGQSINMKLVVAFAFINGFPVALITGILLLFFWRKLLRTREFYADAGVAHAQKNIVPLMQQIMMSERKAVTGQRGYRARMKRFRKALPAQLKRLLTAHPTPVERLERLEQPALVFDDWKMTGLLIGFFTLAMEQLLSSTAAIQFVVRWPLHFPILATVILISLALIVRLISTPWVWREGVKIIALVFLVRVIWVFLAIIALGTRLLIDPQGLARSIEGGAAAVIGYSGFGVEGMLLDPLSAFLRSVVTELVHLVVSFGVTLLAIAGNLWLTRQILTWYRFPHAERYLMRMVYLGLAVVALTVALVVLLLGDVVSLNVAALLGHSVVVLPVLVLISILGTLAFWLLNSRYAQKCGSCRAAVPGYFTLGAHCVHCQRVLHPWLLVEYTTSFEQSGSTIPTLSDGYAADTSPRVRSLG